MIDSTRKPALRVALAAVAAVVASLALGSTAFAAGAPGYTPPPNAGNAPGFTATTCVDQTVPTSGGNVTCTLNGTTINVAVPNGASSSCPLEIIITSSPPGGINVPIANPGYHVVLVVGIEIICSNTGQKFTGTFTPPLLVTVSSSLVQTGGQVALYQAGSWSNGSSVSVSSGSFQIPITGDPDVALLEPSTASTTGAPIPGATSAPTGVPVRGDLLIGAGLVLLGLLGSLFVIRSRRESTF